MSEVPLYGRDKRLDTKTPLHSCAMNCKCLPVVCWLLPKVRSNTDDTHVLPSGLTCIHFSPSNHAHPYMYRVRPHEPLNPAP